jgi:hypothetical protein
MNWWRGKCNIGDFLLGFAQGVIVTLVVMRYEGLI